MQLPNESHLLMAKAPELRGMLARDSQRFQKTGVGEKILRDYLDFVRASLLEPDWEPSDLTHEMNRLYSVISADFCLLYGLEKWERHHDRESAKQYKKKSESASPSHLKSVTTLAHDRRLRAIDRIGEASIYRKERNLIDLHKNSFWQMQTVFDLMQFVAAYQTWPMEELMAACQKNDNKINPRIRAHHVSFYDAAHHPVTIQHEFKKTDALLEKLAQQSEFVMQEMAQIQKAPTNHTDVPNEMVTDFITEYLLPDITGKIAELREMMAQVALRLPTEHALAGKRDNIVPFRKISRVERFTRQDSPSDIGPLR